MEVFLNKENQKDKMTAKVKVLIPLLLVAGVIVYMRRLMVQIQSPESTITTCECDTPTLTDDDQWFPKHYDKTVEPFLKASYVMPQDAFGWWKYLQNERRSYEFFNQTVTDLFQFLPPSPDVMKPSPDRCRSCAVVGNSGNLRGSRYGRLIDSHDVIIRMNTGQIRSYEEDVGRRTTHRIMYPESAMDLDNTTHLVLFPFKIQDIQWVKQALSTGFFGRSYMPVRSKIKANKNLVMVVNPAFMRYVHETWLEKKGRYPSTGFIALVLALHICDEIHVFGFGADKDGNWSHYWETLRNKKLGTGIHPGIYEYETILKLAKHLKIKFYRGW